MTRVAVFGPDGMLGRQVLRAITDKPGYTAQPVYRRMFDLLNRQSILEAVRDCDAIINCAGMIPKKEIDVIDMVRVNSEFPFVLASTGLPTLLVSTDCVFSGRSLRKYNTSSIPDPRDYYGKSKALGEVIAPNVCVVRTSFIGCDHGFLFWIRQAGQLAKSLEQTQTVAGWKNALWTGSTVQVVASSLIDLLDSQPNGIVHLSTEQVISKYDLALKLVELFELDVHVQPTYQPTHNRGLEPTIILPDIDTALLEYKCAGTVYDTTRSVGQVQQLAQPAPN